MQVALPELIKLMEQAPLRIKRDAVRNAMNRAVTQGRTAGRRAIMANYSYKATAINKTFKIYRATNSNSGAALQSKGRRTPLILMGARQTAKGVSVRVGKTRKLIKSAFIATMKSGHKGVFIRTTKRSKPIKELWTIGIPEAFGAKPVINATTEKMEQSFYKRLEYEFNRLMGVKGGTDGS